MCLGTLASRLLYLIGAMQKWPVLVALLVADMVPTAALRDCVVQALEQAAEPPLVVLPQALVAQPRGPIDALRLAITMPDGSGITAPRHLDPCLAQP
jgi:hypothetical protein